MKKRLLRFLAVCLSLSVLSTACGDGEEEVAEQKKTFVAQANKICADANNDFEKLFETDFPTIAEKTPDFFKKAAPLIKKRMEDLRALAAPEADRARINEIFVSGDRAVRDFERASKEVEYGQEIFAAEGGDNEQEFGKKAKDYGLTRCAEDEEGEMPKKKDPEGFSKVKADYVEKVDAVCKKADEQFAPVEEKLFTKFPPELRLWASGVPQVAAIFGPAIEQIRSIEAPPGDRAKIKEIMDRQSANLEKLIQAGEAAKAGDAARFDELAQEVFPAFDEIDASLIEYGFQVCGSEDEQ